MRRSSTSNSEPRRWRAYAIIVVALLAATEAVLRLPHVRALLPPRTHYYHPAIAQGLDAIDRVKFVHGRVDVLFIGSSIVRTNVHPLLFDSLAAQQPRQVVSFNAGLSGLWPTSVHLYTEHVWLPHATPRLVIQGVRYAEIAVTTHAKNETQVWTGRIEPSWREASLFTRGYAAAVSRVVLLQYHGALTRELERFRDGWMGTADPEEDNEHAARGYYPRGASLTSVDKWEEDLPNEGACTDGRCATGFAALHRTIEAVRATGGTYILVNVPEHPARWRGPDAVERYGQYVDALRRFAEAERVGFVDPTDRDPFRFAEIPYNDYAHMTAAGARQFTRELARRMAPMLETALRRSPALHAALDSEF